MPRPIAVIDAETDPFKRGRVEIKPFIWGFYDGKTYEEFTKISALPKALQRKAKKEGMRDVAEFIPFLEEKEIIVYAHNGGKFDYHFLLDHLEPFEQVMIIGGRLSRFKIGLCQFRDSFNIIPVGLDKWQKQVFDYSILEESERYKPYNWKKIRDYLYSDCVNLFTMVSAFIDRFGLHITQASASMKHWQGVANRTAPNSGPEFYADFKPFYYGGRVECFEAGLIERPFKMIDIKSAYPFAMLSEHPISLTYDVINDWNPDAITGSDFYHIEAIAHGSLPYRYDDQTLLFPNDRQRREYFITGWELKTAIETETIDTDIKLQARYVFHELTDFKDYIIPLYNERKAAVEAGDKATDLFNKLHMNGLYGKFAANPAEYGEYMLIDPEFAGVFEALRNGSLKRGHLIEDLRDYEFAGELGPWVMGKRDMPEERQRFYNVATAASITGFVRAYLWRALCQCGGVLYCDTDSIAATDISANTLGNELGDWGSDGEFSRGAIAGKKLYAFRYKRGKEPTDKTGKKILWKIASKGGRLEAREIVRICKGSKVTYIPESPTFSIFKDPAINTRDFVMTAKIMPNLNKNKLKNV
jgi:hypothetical protein